MIQPTTQHNKQLNDIKEGIRKDIKGPGYEVHGEFIANTNQSKGYLAFISLVDSQHPNGNKITHFEGIPLSDLHNTNECIAIIKERISNEMPDLFKE